MINKFLFLLSIVILSLFSACSRQGETEEYAKGRNPYQSAIDEKNKQMDKSFTSANKIISDKEKQRIQSFISRRSWNMQEVSGVYVEEVRKGVGQKIDENNTVTIEYNSYYINGSSADDFNKVEEETQQKTFNNKKQSKDNILTFNVAGDTRVVYGLIYAVKQLSKGSTARIIVPDNLAFYLDDNGEKIKANATLIYEIKVNEVISNKR